MRTRPRFTPEFTQRGNLKLKVSDKECWCAECEQEVPCGVPAIPSGDPTNPWLHQWCADVWFQREEEDAIPKTKA